jgi:hypothetical protein
MADAISIILAMLLGGTVGFERQLNRKPAGVGYREKCRIWFVFFVMMIAGGCAFGMEKKTNGMGFMDYCGYSNCVKLENENTRVILCPAAGGRVLEYSFKGENCLYLDHSQDGWVYEPGKSIDPYGGRFDIGPEAIIPQHPDLWLGKWTAEITGPLSARMTSVKDTATGVQLIRDFTLDRSTSKLLCTQTIRNISDSEKTWCYWGRTLARGGGICIIPLTASSRFPNKYIMYEPNSLINYKPQDPNTKIADDYIVISGTPKYPKLGIDSYVGWLCYLTKNNLILVKQFATYPDRVYNEIAPITISIWYYKDLMCELEPIGPMEKIALGSSVSFTEQWWLLPYQFPAGDRQINLKEIEQTVEKNARLQ